MSAANSILEAYTALPHTPPGVVARVRSLCGNRWADLLLHTPTGFVDRRNVTTVMDAENGRLCTLKVRVIGHRPPPRGNHRVPWKIDVADDTGPLQIIYFNAAPWLKTRYPEGGEVWLSGTVEGFMTEKQMVHPDVYAGDLDTTSVAKLWPTYPLTAGVTQPALYRAVKAAFAVLNDDISFAPDWLPEHIKTEHSWPTFHQALDTLHHPQTPETLTPDHPARLRLAFDELLAFQVALFKSRAETQKHPGLAHKPGGPLRQQFLHALPFALTADQHTAIDEIDTDMLRPVAMLRLLQGDVGAGKTLVALAALLRAVESGAQGAFMAPTDILATQHYETALQYLEPLGITCALLKGKMKASEKRTLREAAAAGKIKILIGTHALIEDGVAFENLGLVVIDEQHRFGVRQRLRLTEKGFNHTGLMPDVLVMTATPIPRTLALTAYGDMDVSIIREKPPGRTPVTTLVKSQENLPEVATALGRLIHKGEQAYWVCPLVDESEKIDLAAATQRYDDLKQLYGDKVALLHGKMKAAEKDAVMADFKAGKYSILVSTTVIEVGVDVPNATTMVIEHAERFGLAQLHQLRGRVGRSHQQSHCILIYQPPLSSYAKERLQVLRETDDGFIIAEKDLELRGPGETMGTTQSGHLITRIADLHHHQKLVPEARQLAKTLTESEQPPQQQAAVEALLRLFERQDAERLIKSG